MYLWRPDAQDLRGIVGQAPDPATAQAGKTEAIAAIQQEAGKTIQFTEAPSLGDGAAYFTGRVSVSGTTFNGSALYGLNGLVFYGFSDIALGHATPTSAVMLTEAQTILSRLP
jgi:hypothetical protein